MKRCPECRRDYHDDTLSFCLADGTPLVYGLGDTEPQTVLLTEHDGRTAAVYPSGDSAPPSTPRDPSKGLKRTIVFAAAIVLLGAGFVVYRYVASGSKQIESVAVMPFINGSGDQNLEYLSDGMTETLINSLSRVPGLNVKA